MFYHFNLDRRHLRRAALRPQLPAMAQPPLLVRGEQVSRKFAGNDPDAEMRQTLGTSGPLQRSVEDSGSGSNRGGVRFEPL